MWRGYNEHRGESNPFTLHNHTVTIYPAQDSRDCLEAQIDGVETEFGEKGVRYYPKDWQDAQFIDGRQAQVRVSIGRGKRRWLLGEVFVIKGKITFVVRPSERDRYEKEVERLRRKK